MGTAAVTATSASMHPGVSICPMPEVSPQNQRLKRTATWIAVVYFVAMAIVLTFPGVIPFNSIRPLVLGVPFIFAWYIAWVIGALCVFGFLDKVFRE